MSLFCRHNRFTADCPICSKGTVLDPDWGGGRRPPTRAPSRSPARKRPSGPPSGAARVAVGPYAAAGPYEREDGHRYEVRLERVPGGIRLGSWAGRALERRAPVLRAADVPALVREAGEREVLRQRDRERLAASLRPPDPPGPGSAGLPGAGAAESGGGAAPGAAAPAEEPYGTSPGRAGELPEELRVEPLSREEGLVRVARWLYRPGPGQWELQEAPPMLPAARFAEALESAVRRGVLQAT